MDNCRLYEDLLVQEALGENSEKDGAFLRAHLDSCAECRGALAALADTVGALRREKRAEAPAGLAERTLHRIERTGKRFAAASAPYHETQLLHPGTWRVRRSLVGWMVAASILVMAVATLMPGMVDTDGRSAISACQDHLRTVAMALRQYATDHNGNYPTGAQWYTSLDYEYLNRTGALLCPARLAVGAPSEAKVDYIYNGQSHPSVNAPADYPLLWDRKGAHDRLGRNVMFADGRVAWVGEDEFQQALARYKINEAELFKQSRE